MCSIIVEWIIIKRVGVLEWIRVARSRHHNVNIKFYRDENTKRLGVDWFNVADSKSNVNMGIFWLREKQRSNWRAEKLSDFHKGLSFVQFQVNPDIDTYKPLKVNQH